MLNVHTEQEKSVYLRGFTGGKYENGTWKPLPDAAYGGENIGMLDWLQTQGLDPFTQSAAYYRLTGDAPEVNTVEVSVQNASRDAVYAPASMEKVTDGDVYERRDALLKGRGLFGIRNYTVTEVSGTRPSELMVAESWVSSPQTEEQTAYAEAESVYRSFVYDAYTAADEKLLPVLNRLFWQDYDDENDGVYSALSRIREVLKAQVRYSETAEAAPDNADPIAYFLTNSRKGNISGFPHAPRQGGGQQRRTAFAVHNYDRKRAVLEIPPGGDSSVYADLQRAGNRADAVGTLEKVPGKKIGKRLNFCKKSGIF